MPGEIMMIVIIIITTNIYVTVFARPVPSPIYI